MNRPEPKREENFDFEKLIVYQKAMSLRRLIQPLTSKPPRKAAKLVDELDRAVDSILLNVPEGCGRPMFSKGRREFYRKALGSAKEAASSLNILVVKEQVPTEMARIATRLILEIVRMLEAMIRHLRLLNARAYGYASADSFIAMAFLHRGCIDIDLPWNHPHFL